MRMNAYALNLMRTHCLGQKPKFFFFFFGGIFDQLIWPMD